MNNINPEEINEYEYTFGEYMGLKISIIGYRNKNIEPYIKIYKTDISNNKTLMCRLSLLESKYIGLDDEDLILSHNDIYSLYLIIRNSPFNIYAMFAHTIEESLNPYLSDEEINDILERDYIISNRNYDDFHIPNYFNLAIRSICDSQILGKNKISIL